MQREERRERAREIAGSEQHDIIRECEKHIGEFYGYFAQNLRFFREDKLFYMGEQWADWAIKIQQEEKKNTLVINLIKPIVRMLLGSISMLDPQLMVTPRDTNFTDARELETYTNILRAIAYGSDASVAYRAAAENILIGGWGICRVGTRYSDPYTFNQELFVESIPEPSNVFIDPNARQRTKCDARWQGIFQILSKAKFKQEYPHAKEPDSALLISGVPYWDNYGTDDTAIAEYYLQHTEKQKLIALSNGQGYDVEVLKKDVDKELDKYFRMMADAGMSSLIVPSLVQTQERETEIKKFKCYKMTGSEILETYDWISQYPPFVFFDNNSVYRDGKQWTESYIHPAKDAQRIYNFCISEAAYAIEVARKERILATPQQTKGYDDLYKYPYKTLSKLPFNRDPLAPLDKPTIIPAAEVSMSYYKQAEIAKDDVRRALGVFDPNMGEINNNISGAANISAMMQGNMPLQALTANLFSGMEQVGRICMDAIPSVYDTDRLVKSHTVSGEVKMERINQVDGMDKSYNPRIKNDLTKARLNLEIRPGANFELQKQAEDQKLMATISLNPEFAMAGADLMASRIGTPAGYQLSKRLAAFVPPNVKAAEEGKELPPPQPTPQEQAQLQLLQAQIEKLQSESTKNIESIKTARQELEFERQKLMADLDQRKEELVGTIAKAQAEIIKAQEETDKAAMTHAVDLHKHHSTQRAMREKSVS